MLSGLGKYAKKGDEIIPESHLCRSHAQGYAWKCDDLSIITAHSRDIMNRKKNDF